MQCLILAGGLGTRMRTVTQGKPKALLEIGSKTFLEWQLQWLKILGVTEVVLAIGYGADHIVQQVEQRCVDVEYPRVLFSKDGPQLLGTGGAIRNASSLLAEDFLVTYGDSFLFAPLKRLMEKHQAHSKGVTLSIYKNANLGDRSNVFYRAGQPPLYDKFHSTDEMEYIDYGMVAVNKKYFLSHITEGVVDFAIFLTESCQDGNVEIFEVMERFFEIGSQEGYDQFKQFLAQENYDLEAVARAKDLLC